MEQNTVGHIDLHCRSIHDHRSMLQINMEERSSYYFHDSKTPETYCPGRTLHPWDTHR